MRKRLVRKLLREMGGGEPVRLALSAVKMTEVARIAFVARQFGYEYADLKQTANNRLALFVVPDPGPQARERAARNWARYPDAADGGALPPVEPAAVELLKARMAIDLGRQYSDALRVVLSVLALTPIAAAVAIRFREDTAVVVIAGLVWAVLMALLPVGIRAGRRSREEHAARLLAAGFTSVTDRNGRLRYVPPGGLPGPGEPMPRGT